MLPERKKQWNWKAVPSYHNIPTESTSATYFLYVSVTVYCRHNIFVDTDNKFG